MKGLDFGAILMMADALSIPKNVVAEILPGVEVAIMSVVNDKDGSGADEH